MGHRGQDDIDTHKKSVETRKHHEFGTSLLVQWLRLSALNAGGPGSTPGQGTKISKPTLCYKKKKKKLKIQSLNQENIDNF